METQHIQTFWQRNSIMIKSMIVGFLIIVLLIPAAWIQELVRERQERQEQVIAEISSKWANGQKITGPFLVVPYVVKETDEKGKTYSVRHNAYFLPEQLSIHGKLEPEIRKRSIYKVVLYKSELQISGHFAPLKFSALGITPSAVQWNDVHFCVGLSDNRGIAEQLQLNFRDQAVEMNPDLPVNAVTTTGVNALLSQSLLAEAGNHSFNLKLKLNGSARLFFTPVGKQTQVQLQSTYNNASFTGNFLPRNSANNENGFNAQWNISHFTRNIPQNWRDDDKVDIDSSAFGVELLQGIDSYSKTMRAVKYSVLFVALTFCLFFFIEVLQKQNVHPLQYVLVGFALCVFYTLLLSISEYTGFVVAYIIASLATIGLITAYIQSVFGKVGITAVFFAFLSALYGMIYVLIQLQDGSLLLGSIGLFVILALVMYFSRKIDWYGTRKVKAQNS